MVIRIVFFKGFNDKVIYFIFVSYGVMRLIYLFVEFGWNEYVIIVM